MRAKQNVQLLPVYKHAPKYKSGDNVKTDKPRRTFVPLFASPAATVGSLIKTFERLY